MDKARSADIDYCYEQIKRLHQYGHNLEYWGMPGVIAHFQHQMAHVYRRALETETGEELERTIAEIKRLKIPDYPGI